MKTRIGIRHHLVLARAHLRQVLDAWRFYAGSGDRTGELIALDMHRDKFQAQVVVDTRDRKRVGGGK